MAGCPAKSVISMLSGGDQDDLVLAQLDRVAGVLDERGHVAGQEVLPVAATDHQRRVAPGADHRAGDAGVDGEQGERALQPLAHPPHRLGEQLRAVRPRRPRAASASAAASRCAAHSVSVSLANSTPVGLQLGAELGEVLDDAVVDHRDPAVGATVRVGVAVGGAAVGGPAGVADAGGAVADADRAGGAGLRVAGGPLGEHLLQVGQLAGLLLGQQLVVADDGDAGRVVAAVLQPPQTVEHDAERRARAGVTHDSTHGPRA